MASSLAARSRWMLAIILLAGIAFAWSMRRKPPQNAVAYVGDRTATLWSTTAQVRQSVASLHYGERVAVLRRAGDQVQVRTNAGAQGWMDARLLMDPDLWQRAAELLLRAKDMPVQAVGHTRTFSNVRVDPGRNAPRIFQLPRNVPVIVLERGTAAAPAIAVNPSPEDKNPPDDPKANSDDPKGLASSREPATAETRDQENKSQETRNEDWLFVLRVTSNKSVAAAPALTAAPYSPAGASGVSSAAPASDDLAPPIPIAGWVLARFIELDPPAPIPDYSNAAGMHVVAWFVLNTVTDASGDKPQYLVLGSRGGEGQVCDFNSLHVYTWGTRQQRYETAYVEGNLCGHLPVRVRTTPAGPEFRFMEAGKQNGERAYRMRQTSVRRVINEGAPSQGKNKRR